jgi:hypothetical protein
MGIWEHVKLGELPPAKCPRDLLLTEIPHNMQRNKKGVIYMKLLCFSFVR